MTELVGLGKGEVHVEGKGPPPSILVPCGDYDELYEVT